MSVIFDKSVEGRRGVALPECDVPADMDIPATYRRSEDADLCELSELDVIRHFTQLSRKNFGVDSGFYPLGSCTMKYNPKVLEDVASLEGFSELHPFLPQLRYGGMLTQGALLVIYELFTGLGRPDIEARFEGKGYIDLKKELAAVVVEGLYPLQSRYQELTAEPGYIDSLLAEGASRVQPLAEVTLAAVKKRIGLG